MSAEEATYKMIQEFDHMVPMRDGVRLATAVAWRNSGGVFTGAFA